MSTGTPQRHPARRGNQHGPPADLTPERRAELQLWDSHILQPPIPQPKPWSDELERAALAGCLGACTPAIALTSMGIAHATADTWLSDEPPEMYRSACLALAGRLKAAQDASEKMLLGRILRASEDPRHWTAGAWILERSRGYIVRQDRGEGPQVVVNIGVLHVGERRDTPVSQIIDAEAIPASLPSPHRGDSE